MGELPLIAGQIFNSFSVASLFVLAAGITIVQVVANPLIAMLGPPRTAHSRLTFAQAFNSLGTTIFPYVGSILILGTLAKIDPKTLSGAALDAFRTTETRVIVHTYIGLAIALALIAPKLIAETLNTDAEYGLAHWSLPMVMRKLAGSAAFTGIIEWATNS